VKQLLLFLAVSYVSITAIAALMADRMIFLPPPPSYTADELGITFVPIGGEHRLATLHLPNPTAEFTILYSHGNAEDLGHLAPLLFALRNVGFSVLAYDYRGYGASTGGPPGTRAAQEDLEAVFRHARENLGIPASRIVLFGRSVGSGPAVALAAREEVGGLILESAFLSAYRVITRIPLLPFDRFPNLRRLGHVRSPVLVIHGTRDEVVPFWHGRKLHDAVTGPRRSLWVEGGGHNDLILVAGDRYWAALEEFRETLTAAQDR
jgi:abhydrolase domain-containing protein 17